MKLYLLALALFAAMAGCSVYNTDTSRIYGIGSDQWHETVRGR